MDKTVESTAPFSRRKHTPGLLIAIGITKLLKAAFLLLAAIAVLHFLNHDIEQFVNEWAERLRLDPGGPIIRGIVADLLAVNHKTYWLISIFMMIYAALYSIEGIGLLWDKTWAEWMTVVTTAGFIPLEIYEIFRHPTAPRVVLLMVNALILAYLIYYVRRKIKLHRAQQRPQTTA